MGIGDAPGVLSSHRRSRCYHRLYARHAEVADVDEDLRIEALHVSGECGYPAAADVLQRPADSQSRDSEKPAHRIRRLRLSGGSARQGAASGTDLRASADGAHRT